MITYKLTSNKGLIDVDFDSCELIAGKQFGHVIGISGTISIELVKKTIQISGEHGLRDYIEDYGFVIEVTQ
jgi:hypothetical protein